MHIRHIAEVGVPGYGMITPYENVSGGDPRYMHFYEMDTEDPETAFKTMTPLVEAAHRRQRDRRLQAVGLARSASDHVRQLVPARRRTQRVSDFFDVVRSQRACRDFAPEPLDDDLVAKVLEAATFAPSAENQQPWEFIVVRDEAARAQIHDLAEKAWAGGGRAFSEQRLTQRCSPTSSTASPVAVTEPHRS